MRSMNESEFFGDDAGVFLCAVHKESFNRFQGIAVDVGLHDDM